MSDFQKTEVAAPTVEERLEAAEETIDVLLAAVDLLGHHHIFHDLTPEARAVIERWALLRMGL